MRKGGDAVSMLGGLRWLGENDGMIGRRNRRRI